jgi:hypothetical protein
VLVEGTHHYPSSDRSSHINLDTFVGLWDYPHLSEISTALSVQSIVFKLDRVKLELDQVDQKPSQHGPLLGSGTSLVPN